MGRTAEVHVVLHPKAHTLQAGDLLSSIDLVSRHDQVTIECDIKKPLVLKPGPWWARSTHHTMVQHGMTRLYLNCVICAMLVNTL
jgi:hypothetical protein